MIALWRASQFRFSSVSFRVIPWLMIFVVHRVSEIGAKDVRRSERFETSVTGMWARNVEIGQGTTRTTRGLAEITRLGVALGGRRETFMGPAGVVDVILTCAGELTRNRAGWAQLWPGDRRALQRPRRAWPYRRGSVPTARAVAKRSERHRIEMPITRAAVDDLMAREQTP